MNCQLNGYKGGYCGGTTVIEVKEGECGRSCNHQSTGETCNDKNVGETCYNDFFLDPGIGICTPTTSGNGACYCKDAEIIPWPPVEIDPRP